MAYLHFEKAYNGVKKTVEFQESWKNSLGYFDLLIHRYEFDSICKTVDSDGRKIIIVPTIVGNVIIFQRHKNCTVIVSNEPVAIKQLVAGLDMGTALGQQELEFYLGTDSGIPHIGERLKALLNLVRKVQ